MSLIDLYIVDDSEMNNQVASKVAKKNARIGEVTCFTNAKVALETILQTSRAGESLPDLILLDILMPEMSGYEWIDEIDEEFDEFTPVVVLVSATNQQKDFESLKKQRIAKELIGKPLTSEMIDELIDKYF